MAGNEGNYSSVQPLTSADYLKIENADLEARLAGVEAYGAALGARVAVLEALLFNLADNAGKVLHQ